MANLPRDIADLTEQVLALMTQHKLVRVMVQVAETCLHVEVNYGGEKWVVTGHFGVAEWMEKLKADLTQRIANTAQERAAQAADFKERLKDNRSRAKKAEADAAHLQALIPPDVITELGDLTSS